MITMGTITDKPFREHFIDQCWKRSLSGGRFFYTPDAFCLTR